MSKALFRKTNLLLEIWRYFFPAKVDMEEMRRQFEREAQEEIDRKYPTLAKYRRRRKAAGT